MTAEPVYRWLNKVPWPASAGSYEHTMAAVRARMAQDLVTPSSDKPAILQETQRVLKEYFAAQPGRAFLEGFFRQVHDWAARHGVGHDRLLLGEFGALRSDARYTAALSADRNRYLRDVREVAESYKIPWAFWNLFDGMGLMDDSTRILDNSVLEALGLARPDGLTNRD